MSPQTRRTVTTDWLLTGMLCECLEGKANLENFDLREPRTRLYHLPEGGRGDGEKETLARNIIEKELDLKNPSSHRSIPDWGDLRGSRRPRKRGCRQISVWMLASTLDVILCYAYSIRTTTCYVRKKETLLDDFQFPLVKSSLLQYILHTILLLYRAPLYCVRQQAGAWHTIP